MGGRKTMPGLSRRKARDGTLMEGYYFRFLKPDGRRTSVFAGNSYEEAKGFALECLAGARHGAAPEEKAAAAPRTLAEYLVTYLSFLEMRVEPSTFRTVRAILLLTAEHFGERPLERYLRADVESWLALLRSTRGSKPNTLRRYHSALAVVFDHARDAGLVETNPCRGIRLPKAQEIPIRFLEPADLERIYAACVPEVGPFIVVLAETGLRLGEAQSLTWQDIAPAYDRITVRKSKSHRTRILDLTPRGADAFREMERRRGPVPLIGLQPVFGKGYDDSWVRRLFHQAVRKAGFETLRLHDLRHGFASSLVRAGVPIPTVAELLGHSSPELTLTRYGKHAPSDAGHQAIVALAKYRGQVPAAPAEKEAPATRRGR